MQGKVFVSDLVDVLRERLELIIPLDRRVPDWDEKWQRLEEVAHVANQN